VNLPNSDIIIEPDATAALAIKAVIATAIFSIAWSFTRPLLAIALYDTRNLSELNQNLPNIIKFLIPNIIGNIAVTTIICAIVARQSKTWKKFVYSVALRVLPFWITLIVSSGGFSVFRSHSIAVSYASGTLAMFVGAVTLPPLLHFLKYRQSPDINQRTYTSSRNFIMKVFKQFITAIVVALILLLLIFLTMYLNMRAAFFLLFVFANCFTFVSWLPVSILVIFLIISANFTSIREFRLAAILACLGVLSSGFLQKLFDSGVFNWGGLQLDWTRDLSFLPGFITLVAWSWWMYRGLVSVQNRVAYSHMSKLET
jgi:hypothetical protein